MTKLEESQIIRAPAVESVSPFAAKQAQERLSNLTTPGRYLFALYSASNPIPFRPIRIYITREKISRSTHNNRRLGSVFNNWCLSTVFDEAERPFLSIENLRDLLGVTKEEFEEKASRYFFENHLFGKAKDITTWSGLVRKNGEIHNQDLGFALRGLFKAAGKSSTFCVLRDIGIVALRNVEIADMEKVKVALDKIFIAMNISTKVFAGIAVPALHRALMFWFWVVFTVSIVTYIAKMKLAGLELWTMEYLQALVFVGISVPALVEYISKEPFVIRNAMRANRILWKNSQVKKYFKLSRFDYAVMALVNDPMWLVSDDKAGFTQQGGHPDLVGDVHVTDTHALRKIGFYVGRSMARREWEDRCVQVGNRADGSVRILERISDGGWISGEGENRPVG